MGWENRSFGLIVFHLDDLLVGERGKRCLTGIFITFTPSHIQTGDRWRSLMRVAPVKRVLYLGRTGAAPGGSYLAASRVWHDNQDICIARIFLEKRTEDYLSLSWHPLACVGFGELKTTPIRCFGCRFALYPRPHFSLKKRSPLEIAWQPLSNNGNAPEEVRPMCSA